MVPEAEWAFWMDDGQMSRAPEGDARCIRECAPRVHADGGRSRYVQGWCGGGAGYPRHGRTRTYPGHTAFLISDGDDQLLIWSDTTNKPELFVRHPTWQAVFDMDGDLAVQPGCACSTWRRASGCQWQAFISRSQRPATSPAASATATITFRCSRKRCCRAGTIREIARWRVWLTGIAAAPLS